MKIWIDDATDERIEMDIEDTIKELYPWIILNLDEIGNDIAIKFLDIGEEPVSREYLDDEISDWFLEIREKILERAVYMLENEGVDIYEN